MNKHTVIAVLLLICLIPALAFAQDEETTIQQGNKTIIIKKSQGDLGDLEQLKKLNIEMQVNTPEDESADAPFFGIYPTDLDFPKAQALNYPNSYGVLITGIVPNSPAYQYRLAEDDIIMEINGKKALNLKEFDKLKAVYRAGDAVNLTIFRSGEVKSIDFVFGSRIKPQIPSPGEVKSMKKERLSAGSGGGTWIPMWFEPDMEDVNELVTAIGFSKLPEDGVLTQGLGGKGNVGKGWMLGGQFQWYSDSKKVSETDTDYVNSMDYSMFIGGATLDKRFPITRNITTSLGVMLGGGSHTVDLVHSNGNYNWPDSDTDTEFIMDSNSNATFSKGYILVQPRAELMIHILSWLAIRGEVGYIYGYGPTSGWKVKHNDSETYEFKNSPDTPFEGLTFTVGPWFGF